MRYGTFPLTDAQKWGKKPRNKAVWGVRGGALPPPAVRGQTRPRPRGTRMGPTWRGGRSRSPLRSRRRGGRAGSRWGRADPLRSAPGRRGRGGTAPATAPSPSVGRCGGGRAARRRAGRGRRGGGGGGRCFPRGPAGGMSAAAAPLTDHRRPVRWGAGKPGGGCGWALGEGRLAAAAGGAGSCCPGRGRGRTRPAPATAPAPAGPFWWTPLAFRLFRRT